MTGGGAQKKIAFFSVAAPGSVLLKGNSKETALQQRMCPFSHLVTLKGGCGGGGVELKYYRQHEWSKEGSVIVC